MHVGGVTGAAFVFEHADQGLQFRHAAPIARGERRLHAARAVDEDLEIVNAAQQILLRFQPVQVRQRP